MKNFGLIFLIFLLPSICLGQFSYFNTQAELNNFDTTITSFPGSIVLNSENNSDPIFDLSPLENLTQINGHLDIVAVNATSLEGLHNLEKIDGRLWIKALNQITNIHELSNLDSIGGLTIISNDQLEDISALENIDSLSGNLQIAENPNLTTLTGLDNIIYVGGTTAIGSNDLNNLAALSNLHIIGGDLIISNNDNIQSLTDLSNLDSIGASIRIGYNSNLTSLNGLPNLTKINGDISIGYNDALIDISALNNLDTISADILIYFNPSLSHLDSFTALTYVGGKLRVLNNDQLQDINGFYSLETVGDYIHINSNPNLDHIEGFNNLSSLSRFLSITNNENLLTIGGFSNLINIDERLFINYNAALTNIDGFSNLTSIGTDLEVSHNSSLSDCCILIPLLSNPDAVGDEIIIEDNNVHCSSTAGIFEYCVFNFSLNFPCINAFNGSIQIQAIANTPPYQYTWQNITTGQSNAGISNENNFTIPDLSEGTYNLTITDSENNEYIEENIILTSIPGSVFEIIELTTTNSSNTISNGAIHLNIAGGFPPYTYQWTGTSTGNQSGIDSLNFSIPNLAAGEYTITVTDNNGALQTVSLTLLDETVPVFPCTQALDIVILNDVSGSVDPIEYTESKQFFVDFLEEVNIGTGDNESRAAIIEWSDASSQSIQIPIIDNLPTLQNYINNSRAFGGNTAPHEAMTFGKNYLDTNARPDVEKILILSTDGTSGQVSPSLIALADQFKAEGYHIITIAFDDAFSNITTREVLRQVASIDLLAPGAPAYSQLNEDLAENIVNIYLCPIDPGSSATVYFERDGAIDILDIEAIGGCPAPEFAELTFSVNALQELSIPSGMPVTFYYNNPAIFGATPIFTWEVPCAIEAGTIDTFMVSLPITTAANIFAVLNDDGILQPPIQLPLTDIDELAYSNNVADTTLCGQALPTLQTFKYTTTRIPICNNTVIYQVDVCNISSLDALGVVIADDAPEGFVLLDSLVNDNGCAMANVSNFDIPAGCCVSLTYIYDASAAADGNYDNQDVDISGITNQIYLDFDGFGTPAEDVLIDGTVDCPSTEINFTKSVNVEESCDDAFVVYTFTIDNQMNIPLNAVSFSDLLPAPVTWAFQPYNLTGLSISNSNINGNSATFLIDEIAANTVASFSMDAALNDWAASGSLDNTATLSDVLDLVNGGLQTLNSNSVSTEINANPEIEVEWSANCMGVNLDASSDGEIPDSWEWQSLGDGSFTDTNAATTLYIPGAQDSIENSFSLIVRVQTICGEINQTIEVSEEDFELPFFENITNNPEVNGNANGTAMIIGSGGLPPYTYEWSTGETTAMIENLTAGDYSVTLTDAEGCSISTSTTVSFITGTQQEQQNIALYLYPNPAHDFIDIRLSETAAASATELKIIDAHGRILQTVHPNKLREGQFRLPTKQSGVYFLRLKMEGQTIEIRRFVVIR